MYYRSNYWQSKYTNPIKIWCLKLLMLFSNRPVERNMRNQINFGIRQVYAVFNYIKATANMNLASNNIKQLKSLKVFT